MLPEIAARHSSAKTVFRTLRTKFFKNTGIALPKKIEVASLLSRECFGSGGHPLFNTNERSRIHANVMSVYRTSLSETFGSSGGDDMLTDSAVLHIHGLRAPYTLVRFSRLRMSVRLFNKAPIRLLGLLYAARDDS